MDILASAVSRRSHEKLTVNGLRGDYSTLVAQRLPIHEIGEHYAVTDDLSAKRRFYQHKTLNAKSDAISELVIGHPTQAGLMSGAQRHAWLT